MTFQLRPRFLPDKDALREWGGKGAPIARMIQKGYKVPPSAAFGISEIHSWLTNLPEYAPAIEAWTRWEKASEKLSALVTAIQTTPIPEHFKQSLDTTKRLLLGDQNWPLILRSSMSVEDHASGSLAGCFESVALHELSADGFWKAFTQVVASAFSQYSAQTLLAHGVLPSEFRPAVLIQPLLTAQLAGVCFSRPPNNPWEKTGYVEWVEGQGQNLVQGTAKTVHSAKESDPVPQALALFWEELWTRTRIAEQLLGGPADLEWVWDGEQLWFVQMRPIATEEALIVSQSPDRKWSRALTLERFPEPMTPMGWSALRDAMITNLASLDRHFGIIVKSPNEMAICLKGIIYSDPQFFSFPQGVKVRWSRYLAPWKPIPWAMIGHLLSYASSRLMGKPKKISALLTQLSFLNSLSNNTAKTIKKSWAHHRDDHVRKIEEFSESLKITTDPQALLEQMDRLGGISRGFMEPDLAVYLIKDSYFKILQKIWIALGFEEKEFPDLVRSFSGNRTWEMNIEFNHCLQVIRQDPNFNLFYENLIHAHSFEAGESAAEVLSTSPKKEWAQFLKRNGHSTTSWDIAVASWKDNPAQLAPLVKAGVSSKNQMTVTQQQSESLKNRQKNRLEIRLSELNLNHWEPRILGALDHLENFMRIDEEHHFLSGLLLSPSRQLVLMAGQYLCQLGLIERPEDVFFITLDELKKSLTEPKKQIQFDFLVRKRKSEWERTKRQTPPFDLPPSSGQSQVTEEINGIQPHWKGTPMSPGIATGKAIIAEHLHEIGEIAQGSILITTSPNPSLTPIYPLLGGLVAATGGALSHGFVSAREYALPAVSGIQDATRRIQAGATIRINGSTGIVEILEGTSL